MLMLQRFGIVSGLLFAVACSSDKASDDGSADTAIQSGSDSAAGGDDTGTQGDVCTEPTEVSCVDEIILDLALHDDATSGGEVSNSTDGEDFVTYVDATAGGYSSSTDNPWVYIKFTSEGAERVDIDDETALESMDWDMALRRYIVRLNGGSSGPSCVGAVTFLETSYEELTEVPEGITFAPDEYYTSDCTIINDSSGLPNSPQTVLGGWWEYPGCVATTMSPHLIQLADGSVLKLVVEAYYESDQDVCNKTGSGGEGSANITMRWQML